MKTLDIIVAVLLVIGGLNWGLVGALNFDLVGAIFGEMSVLSRAVYTIVGLAAIYDIVMLKAMWKRWGVRLRRPVHA
jgi:uncharacterized membrane protein YuzA (DUF378 family)